LLVEESSACANLSVLKTVCYRTIPKIDRSRDDSVECYSDIEAALPGVVGLWVVLRVRRMLG